MQLFPGLPFLAQRAYVAKLTLETEAEGQVAKISASSSAPIAQGDVLNFALYIDYMDAPLAIFHGETLAHTAESGGPVEFSHNAVSNADYFEFVLTGGANPSTVEMRWPSITKS